MSLKIAAVRLFVDDMVAARRFYADLLGLRSIDATPTLLIFDAGPLLIIEPADDEARREGLVGRFAGVSFAVSDIQALHARLAAEGCTITGPPELQPWGGSLMHVADPSGNVVSFVED